MGCTRLPGSRPGASRTSPWQSLGTRVRTGVEPLTLATASANGSSRGNAMHPRTVEPTPQHLFEVVGGFQDSAALEGAIDLDLFTAIGEGADNPQTLSQRCNASERGVRIVCDYLVTIGVLAKDGGRYLLTPESAMFLDRKSPNCLAPLFKLMLSPTRRAVFSNLASKARSAEPVEESGGEVAGQEAYWVEFARGFAPLDGLAAERLADLVERQGIRPSRVLDLAAGHGLWGIAIARRNPDAFVVAVDRPAVLEVARANAARSGLGARYETIGGDAFQVEFGKDYDLVLITNFLAGMDSPSCEKCLVRAHSALKVGGHLVVLDVVPNEDRVTPLVPAQFALTMLAEGGTGEVQTFADYSRLLETAGFESAEISPLLPSVESVIIARR